MRKRRTKGKHVSGKSPATADEVAELYGVHRSAVYRWVASDAFDPAPITIPSPSGQRDRILFDRDAVAKQFEAEMLDGVSLLPLATVKQRREKLEAFRVR
jgi:hypothetical protein